MTEAEIGRAATAIANVLSRKRGPARKGLRQLDRLGFTIDAGTREKVEAMS